MKQQLALNANRLILVCIALMCQQLTAVTAVDKGFELLFTTNPAEHTNLAVRFTGRVPNWLHGRLIRNGIGKMEMGDRSFGHMLDAYGKLMAFTFNGSDVALFSTKFIQTRFYKDSVDSDDIAPYLLFDEPEPSFNAFSKAMQKYYGMDNTNINVHAFKSSSRTNTVNEFKSPNMESYNEFKSPNKENDNKFKSPNMESFNELQSPNKDTVTESKSASSKQNDYMAVSDFWQSYQFDPSTLNTVSYVNPDLPSSYMFGKRVPLPSTAHPVKEHVSDAYISFVSYLSVAPFVSNYIDVIRIKSTMDRESIAIIECDKLPYMHSIGLSKNYAVIFADPLYMRPLNWFHKITLSDMLEWEPTQNTKMHIVHIQTGKVIDLEIPTKIHLHHVNSYESGDHLIVDYIVYPDFDSMKDMSLKTLLNRTARNKIDPGSNLIRYKINLKTKEVTIISFENHYNDVKSDTAFLSKMVSPDMKNIGNPTTNKKTLPTINKMDFPAINPHYQHQNYCYINGLVTKADEVNFAKFALVKKDLCYNQDKVWFRKDHFPTEPVFVPSPDGVSEDDGVILSVILNGRKRKYYLGIFDAKTMNMIAKGYLEDTVPYTLHGGFFEL